MNFSNSNTSSTRPIADLTTKGVRPIANVTILNIEPDGSVVVRFSAKALSGVAEISEAALPTLKLRKAARELKELNRLLKEVDEARSEVKAVQMREMRDPNLAWLSAIKCGSGF